MFSSENINLTSDSDPFGSIFTNFSTVAPPKVSSRSFRSAIEEALMYYTRKELEIVLAEDLRLSWPLEDYQPTDGEYTKRDVIQAYTEGWELPRLVALSRRIVTELDVPDTSLTKLTALLTEYDRGGGVSTPAKNLIFAANGPKPELVFLDAVSNDIEIVRNSEYCLVFDQPIPADGLTYNDLIDWWRKRQGIAKTESDRDVGRDLHKRLCESLGNNTVEKLVFDSGDVIAWVDESGLNSAKDPGPYIRCSDSATLTDVTVHRVGR